MVEESKLSTIRPLFFDNEDVEGARDCDDDHDKDGLPGGGDQ